MELDTRHTVHFTRSESTVHNTIECKKVFAFHILAFKYIYFLKFIRLMLRLFGCILLA